MTRTFDRGLLFPLWLTITTIPVFALDLYYDFEGDVTTATDKLTDDGEQNGTFFNSVEIETEDVPFGNQASRFSAPEAPDRPEMFSIIEIPGTMELGTEWTESGYGLRSGNFYRSWLHSI